MADCAGMVNCCHCSLARGLKVGRIYLPARLALVVLGRGNDARLLRERAQFLIDDDLQKRSSRYLTSVCENGRQITSLEKAGLAALGLRERWRLSQNWKEVFTTTGFLSEESCNPENWRTALACLYGLVPDSAGMLDVLSDLDTHSKYQSVISHVLLANPLLEDERQKQFLKLLEKKPLSIAVTALRGMAVLGETGLAKQLAEGLLEKYPDVCKDAKNDWATLDSYQLLHSMDRLQSLAALCHLSGQSKKSTFLLKAIDEAAQYWHAGLHLQRLATSEMTGEAEGIY